MKRLSLLLCLGVFFGNILHAQTASVVIEGFNGHVAIRSNGRTTGQIAVVEVHNNTSDTFYTAQQLFYIPSEGKYQDYVGRVPEGQPLPPGLSSFPLEGYCTDVYRKPVPAGEAFPNFDRWVGLEAVPEQPDHGRLFLLPVPRVPAYQPKDTIDRYADHISGLLGIPISRLDSTDASVLPVWPGTHRPIRYQIDVGKHPKRYAPILIDALLRIENAASLVQENPALTTPFASDSLREREAIIQQTLWIYTAGIKGKSYLKEQFAERVYAQFEVQSHRTLKELPPSSRQQLDQGIDDFWGTFTATGLEAKLLVEQKQEVKETDMRCFYDSDLHFSPDLDADLKISEHWGSDEEREEIRTAILRALSQGLSPNAEEAYSSYDLQEHPTSALGFWRENHIGGWASAYAKTRFSTDRGAEWVWWTENLSSEAEGESTLSMQMERDVGCRSIVIGSALVKLQARADAFDAVGSQADQLEFLKAIRWLAKQSLLYLIESGAGLTRSSFSEYVEDAVTSEVRAVLEDELERQAALMLEQVAEALDLELNEEMSPVEQLQQIRVALEALSGEAIPEFTSLEELTNYLREGAEEDLLDELMATIEEGVDALLNMLVWSNTYATANGSLVVHVGSLSEHALVSARSLYTREGYERNEEAVHGIFNSCDGFVLSDAQEDQLEIKTWGRSSMTAQAEGNGSADAQLYSLNIDVLFGVCLCPNDPPQISEAAFWVGWYLPGESLFSNEDVENLIEGARAALQAKVDGGDLTVESSLQEWSMALDAYMREKGEELRGLLNCH